MISVAVDSSAIGDEDRTIVIVDRLPPDAHDGPGWYWWLADYPDEGACGAFSSLGKAIAHANHTHESCPSPCEFCSGDTEQ